MLHRLALVLALTSTGALAAPVQTPAPDRAALKQFCTGDYLTYCGNFPPDGPEVQACFKQNKAKLSQTCQAAITGYVKAQRKG
ncbi:conserved hypothetical protein; putative exported protein [Methylobacterium sp. 4-46]|uniref:hypothetical protein n=1 Tax=unclassified Methylobacterium TaxID=2615210 RepID=UPI000152DB9B|nr:MULTISPECIES: hypothetical protein [Methylobacterium]ACA20540.1 conserved hypothetical protein; putative exported protein [Methylobacterium sp. 4-46]WFT79707.1 hypothetical protein QA634_31695 [Methylobacterium nodulans]